MIKSHAAEYCGSEVEAIIHAARRIDDGIFPVASGGECDFSRGLEWRRSFEDVEDLFYLNRWFFGITLAKAFVYTGDASYARRFFDVVDDWAASNPMDPASPAWESYSVSERIVNGIFALHLVQGCEPYASRAEALRRRIAGHAGYLAEHLEIAEIHNHVINNARALFEFGLLYPDLPRARECRDLGWRILRREIERQVDGDGFLGEQSVPYHFLLLRTFAEVALLARRNRWPVGEEFEHKLQSMFLAADLFVRPDGSVPAIGDVSPDAPVASLVGTLGAGACVFGFDVTPRVTEPVLWLLDGSVPEAGTDPAPPGAARLRHLPESGFAVYRGADLHVTLRSDPRGEVVRHGHDDVLALDVWFRGRPVVCDSGNPSYAPGGWEEFFRGPRAHAAVLVDGLPPQSRSPIERGLFRSGYRRAAATLATQRGMDGVCRMEAAHTGYMRLPDPVRVERRVRIARSAWVWIEDTIVAREDHDVEILWPLGTNRFEDGVIRDPDGTRIADLSFRSDRPHRVEVLRGVSGARPGGWISPAYGGRVPATTLSCRFRSRGVSRFRSLILLDPSRTPLVPDLAPSAEVSSRCAE